MTSERHTLLVRACAFLLGAALDYLYLLALGKVTFSNLVFLLFFSGVFAVFVNELVGHYSMFGFKIDRVSMFFTEIKTRETSIEGPQTVLVPLLFCIAIASRSPDERSDIRDCLLRDSTVSRRFARAA